jgi:hypothetical protein
MEEVLPYGKHFNPNIWYKDSKDEPWERPRKKSPEGPTLPPQGKRRDAFRPELQLAPLLRAAWAVAEREDLVKHAEALANELEVSVEWVYYMGLVEFIETRIGGPREHGDALRRASPFWQTHQYTTKELDALLEADTFPPKMAERYKDLLED